MYTKTKIQNLNKNNKILYEKYGWKIVAVFDYNGLIAEAIFNNHFTKTCYRQKDAFVNRALKCIIFPIYILKNEEKKYFRQIEIENKKAKHIFFHKINYKIYDENNIPVGIRQKDIPNEIKNILPKYIKYLNNKTIFLNEAFCLKNPKKLKKNIYNRDKKIKLYIDKNTNDYFILSSNKLINNINNNKELTFKALKFIKNKLINKSIKEVAILISKNEKFISL